jgi:iron complex transport system substrate-binding protein
MNLNSFLLLLLMCISSCRWEKTNVAGSNFPSENQIVLKAEKFTLEKENGFTILTIINPWQGARNINQVYYLVKRGEELPAGIDSSEVIIVPVRKIICMSTTHIAMISALGEENSVAGMSGTGFIFEKSFAGRIEKGLIKDVGYETNLNKELILKIAPGLIMMYGIGNESSGYIGKVKELGVKVVFDADYLETDPLGKAEWIKLFGALYCKENLADSIYQSEVENYNSLKLYISRHLNARPKVLLGLPYKDTWYISPGNSFISTLISDAGGEYLWKTTESSVSMPFGIENVFLSALNADFWLNIGTVSTKNEISVVDQRLEELPCFRKGNLYNNNKRVTESGGNDYWESGTVYPHTILKDISSILHPELFSDYELFYYHKID